MDDGLLDPAIVAQLASAPNALEAAKVIKKAQGSGPECSAKELMDKLRSPPKAVPKRVDDEEPLRITTNQKYYFLTYG